MCQFKTSTGQLIAIIIFSFNQIQIIVIFRQTDLEERDNFLQRMVAKDKDKQRNVATKTDRQDRQESVRGGSKAS